MGFVFGERLCIGEYVLYVGNRSFYLYWFKRLRDLGFVSWVLINFRGWRLRLESFVRFELFFCIFFGFVRFFVFFYFWFVFFVVVKWW